MLNTGTLRLWNLQATQKSAGGPSNLSQNGSPSSKGYLTRKRELDGVVKSAMNDRVDRDGRSHEPMIIKAADKAKHDSTTSSSKKRKTQEKGPSFNQWLQAQAQGQDLGR